MPSRGRCRPGPASGSRVPRQHVHDECQQSHPPWPRTRPATSSSSGRASRPGRLEPRRLRPAVRQHRGPRWAPSSGSTPTRRITSTSRSVASDSSGNFVVVWESRFTRTARLRRRLRPALRQHRRRRSVAEFRVNTLHDELPDRLPAVASDADRQLRRRLEAATRTARAEASSASGTTARRPLGPSSGSTRTRRATRTYPAVASDAAGNFVVVWESSSQDGSSYGVFGQRYDSAGDPLGGEFRVNTYTTSDQALPVGGLGRGRQLRRRLAELSTRTARATASSASATTARERRWAASSGSTPTPRATRAFPSVASDAAGNFVVVWESDGQDGSSSGVFGQRYDSTGAPLGGEFQVNTYTTGDQRSRRWPPMRPATSSSSGRATARTARPRRLRPAVRQHGSPAGRGVPGQHLHHASTSALPSVASDAAGNFVVVWQSYGQDGSGCGVFAQRYDSTGDPLGGEFRVNTYTTSHQSDPSVASDAAGNFVVVWAELRPGRERTMASSASGTTARERRSAGSSG